MPHVEITMFPGRDETTKRELAVKVQSFLCNELSLEKRFVSVSIRDVPKEQWEQSMTRIPAESMFVKPGI